MKYYFLGLVYVFSLVAGAQEVLISSGQLQISIIENDNGVELVSIKDDGVELLSSSSELFSLEINNTDNNSIEILSSSSNWENIDIDNSNGNCTIILTNPSMNLPNLPSSLIVRIYINTSGDKSEWDLSVSGLGNCSLIESTFPILKIKATGNDDFLLPYFYGKLIHNPGSELNYNGLYPRGWGASMQYMAYYNNENGLYFGFHDPKASYKRMIANSGEDDINIEGVYAIPNKTLAGNDWELSGKFELDLFQGDWYDATLIYKEWASNFAEFWPKNTPERLKSQQNIGNIGVWAYNSLSDYENSNLGVAEGFFKEFADFIEIPYGLHLYNWNYKNYDDDYPNYFPERTGMEEMVENLQNDEDVYVMPYINGRLYETNLEGYQEDGFPYAVKDENNVEHTQDFIGNHFAVMCPTQAPWQDTIIDACTQITDRISSMGIYIDQVCAASPRQCMDKSHNHKIGGGSLWRDGYSEMLNRIDENMHSGRFITSEGGCDYLADVVDGFMVQGWTTNNMVPAFSVIYAGKVQLFGTRTGTSQYGNPRFYGKLAQGFIFGAQTGRLSVGLGLNLGNASLDKLMAGEFVKTLGKMRYKLKDFISFGEMQRPLILDVPTITFPVSDYGTVRQSTIDVIQNSVWKHKEDNKLLILFANASMTDNHNVIFDVDFSAYGLYSPLTIQEITSTNDGALQNINTNYSHNSSLQARDVVGYIISGAPTETVETPNQNAIGVYPNPAKNFLKIDGKELINSIRIVNMNGVVLKHKILTINENSISLENIPNGLYLIQVNSNLGVDWYKFVVEK